MDARAAAPPVGGLGARTVPAGHTPCTLRSEAGRDSFLPEEETFPSRLCRTAAPLPQRPAHPHLLERAGTGEPSTWPPASGARVTRLPKLGCSLATAVGLRPLQPLRITELAQQRQQAHFALGDPLMLPRQPLTDLDTGQPIPGQRITFTTGSLSLASATTNSQGVATVPDPLTLFLVVLNGGYNAAYAGNPTHQAATTHAGLL